MRTLITLIGSVVFCLKKKILPIEVPKKILIMRSGSLGDVVMTTPLIRAIAQHYPESQLDYLVGTYSKDILVGNPHLTEILTYNVDIIFNKDLGKIHSLIRNIRGRAYDLCIVLDKSWEWGVLAFLCGIPYRIGFDRKGEGFSFTKSVPFDGSKYEVEYNLDIARILGITSIDSQTELFISKEDFSYADSFVQRTAEHNTLIGFCAGGAKNPGQRMDSKRPKKSRYAKIITELSQDHDILLFGGADDVSISHDIQKLVKEPVLDLTGKLDIKRSAALISRCDLFITHDTGLLHVAAAVGTPVIALFGPTSPARFSPGSAHVISAEQKCNPCYDIYGKFSKKCQCIDDIDPLQVVEKARELLGK